MGVKVRIINGTGTFCSGTGLDMNRTCSRFTRDANGALYRDTDGLESTDIHF